MTWSPARESRERGRPATGGLKYTPPGPPPRCGAILWSFPTVGGHLSRARAYCPRDAPEASSLSSRLPEATFYTVVSGDSLSKIAKVQYGDPIKCPVIFEANQPMLKDPDKIYPGPVLRIPALKQ